MFAFPQSTSATSPKTAGCISEFPATPGRGLRRFMRIRDSGGGQGCSIKDDGLGSYWSCIHGQLAETNACIFRSIPTKNWLYPRNVFIFKSYLVFASPRWHAGSTSQGLLLLELRGHRRSSQLSSIGNFLTPGIIINRCYWAGISTILP